MSANIVIITSNIDMDDPSYAGLFNYFLIDATAGSIVISLPLITSLNQSAYTLCRKDVGVLPALNTVTLQCKSSQTINGSTSLLLNQNNFIQPTSISSTNYFAPYVKYSTFNL